jgi:hypothetical protein
MRKKIIYLSIIFLLYLSIGRSDYQKIIGNYYFFANEKDSLLVHFFINEINKTKVLFRTYFGYSLKRPVYIILPASELEYHHLTNTVVPEWSSGVAFNSKGQIILKPGNYFDPEQYREVILHELTHLYLAEYIGINKIPLWMNEGLSMYLSNKSISWQESIYIGNSINSGDILQLSEIDSLLIFGSMKARLAYLEAFLAIRYLIKQHSEQVLIKLIHDFKNGGSIDQLFFKNLGYDYYDF